jgi:hypothetical protein
MYYTYLTYHHLDYISDILQNNLIRLINYLMLNIIEKEMANHTINLIDYV